jgi:hypothetical protein
MANILGLLKATTGNPNNPKLKKYNTIFKALVADAGKDPEIQNAVVNFKVIVRDKYGEQTTEGVSVKVIKNVSTEKGLPGPIQPEPDGSYNLDMYANYEATTTIVAGAWTDNYTEYLYIDNSNWLNDELSIVKEYTCFKLPIEQAAQGG